MNKNFAKALKIHEQKIVLREQAKHDLEIHSMTERIAAMTAVALNHAFGIGSDRFHEKYVPAYLQVSMLWEQRFNEVDSDYADGKLEQDIKRLLGTEFEIGRMKNI